MKKILFSICMFCIGITTPLCAETTDISSYDNVIYIEPVSVHAGSQHTLSVKMKNSVSAEGFEFYLYLPAGISFNGDPSLSLVRTTTAKTNTFNFTIQNDGALHVFAASTVEDAIIDGNDGEVALVPIEVAEDMAQGDYSLTLKKVAISGSDAQSYGPDESIEIKTTITITEPLASTILDETSTTNPVSSNGAVNVTVNRSIKANTWSTICLPFDMTSAQVKAAFGNDVKLASYNSWSFIGTAPNVDAITLNFVSATDITANTPCLIKVSNAIASFEVKNVEIIVDDAECAQTYSVGSGKNKKNYTCTMFGTYIAGTTDAGDLFLSGNTFYVSNGTTSIKGYRATFYFGDNIILPSAASAARVNLSFVDGDESTSIDQIEVGVSKDNLYYDLQGRLITTPTKGLYIVNGKKVIIK